MNPPLHMPAVLEDSHSPSAQPPFVPQPPNRLSVILRWLPWILAALILISILMTWLIVREPMQQLTPPALAAARQKWSDAGIVDYDFSAEVSGAAGRVDVQVRSSKVVDFLINGKRGEIGEPHSYTVEGLFDVLERELEMSMDPTSPLARQGRVILRVRFDPQYGFPRRYLRVIGGSNKSNEMKIIQFTPMSLSSSS